MKRLLASLLLVLACGMSYAKEAPPLAEDPAVEKRMIAISEEMRCLVCQNESLAASQADLAQDLRRELRSLIKEGKSDEEIKQFMVSRYGDFVLYRPRLQSTTWLLWTGPFILLIAGVAVLVAYLRRRSRVVPETPLSAADAKRAEALLKEGGQ
jgi:cytochrome c-type biogenesis protein CcmH